MTDAVEQDLKKTIILTGERIRAGSTGPGADLLSALSKLANSYYKIRYQKGAPVPGKRKTLEDMTQKEKEAYYLEHGMPDYYSEIAGE